MLGWAAGPAGGQASAALRGERYGPLPPSGWPDKVPPADPIPCGGMVWDGFAGLLSCLVVAAGAFWADGPNRFSFSPRQAFGFTLAKGPYPSGTRL